MLKFKILVINGRGTSVKTFIKGCLQNMLKIKWQYKIQSEELWERTGQVGVQQ